MPDTLRAIVDGAAATLTLAAKVLRDNPSWKDMP